MVKLVFMQKMEKSMNLAWGVDRRFVFIETRLFWEGRLNRRDLVDFFGISIPQASNDLKAYIEQLPDNIEYDTSAKVYVAKKTFKPKFISGDSSEYFDQLLLTQGNGLSESFLGNSPLFDILKPLGRPIGNKFLRDILTVIRENQSVEICYKSMNTPEPEWRWVTPHAFGFDGHRWHLRAYSYKSKIFKDFVLGRILDTREKRPAVVGSSNDLAWNHFVEFVIIPHPRLREDQKKIIETDYNMANHQLIYKVRVAFIFYALKRFGIDKYQLEKDPKQQQIILENFTDIQKTQKLIESMTYENQ